MKLLKSIYAIKGTKQIIDVFPTVKDLHNSMQSRGCSNYEVLYYYELVTKVDESGFPDDADIIATGEGSTILEAKKNLADKLTAEYGEEAQQYLKVLYK